MDRISGTTAATLGSKVTVRASHSASHMQIDRQTDRQTHTHKHTDGQTHQTHKDLLMVMHSVR